MSALMALGPLFLSLDAAFGLSDASVLNVCGPFSIAGDVLDHDDVAFTCALCVLLLAATLASQALGRRGVPR